MRRAFILISLTVVFMAGSAVAAQPTTADAQDLQYTGVVAMDGGLPSELRWDGPPVPGPPGERANPGAVSFGRTFEKVTSIRVDFIFEDDLLDHGECIMMGFFYSNAGAFGSCNTTGSSDAHRISTSGPTHERNLVMLDGFETFVVWTEPADGFADASATLAELRISIEAIAAPTRPGLATIAYGSLNNIMTIDSDGFGRARVTEDRRAMMPAWSPDGTRLAYEVVVGDRIVIEILDLDDGTTELFDPLPGMHVGSPAWSPTGSQLAFSATSSFSWYDIWIANVDGTDTRSVTNDPDGWNRYPDWSPDGSQLAFTSRGLHSDIFVIDVDGTNRTNLTNRTLGDSEPAWSPDGSMIAFHSNRIHEDGSGDDIYVMAADGSNPTRVTTAPGDEWEADWSPDGTKLVYTAKVPADPEPRWTLFTVNVDGSDSFQVTGPTDNAYGPAWHPMLLVAPTFWCNGKAATLVGTEQADHLIGTAGRDVVVALGGDDLIEGLDGSDVICAGPGDDVVYGGAGHDRIFGGVGDDVLRGDGGKDRLVGHAGRDVLLGRWGRDLLIGGPGRDVMAGNSGNDSFKAKDSAKDRLNGGPGWDRAHIDFDKDRVRNVERTY